jgi:hypothetical protein
MKRTAFWDSGPKRPDGGRSKHLENIGQLVRDYTAQYLRKLPVSFGVMWYRIRTSVVPF